MKKETKHITLIISAITIALIGLIALQIYLLIVSYEQKEQAFDRNVVNALNAVSQQIEKEEAASKIFNVAMQIPPSLPKGSPKTLRKLISKDPAKLETLPNGNFTWIISDTVKSAGGNEKQMRIEMFHSSGIDTMRSVVIKGKNSKTKNGSQSFAYSYSTNENNISFSTSINDSAMLILRDTTKKRRGEIVARVVDKLFLVETLPIEQRLDLSRLDSLVKKSLTTVGIDLAYSFRVTVGEHDSVKLTNDSLGKMNMATTPFTTPLFPNDVISQKYELALFLPDKSSFVAKEMTALLSMSFIFISILVGSFIYFIRIVIVQKRFSVSIVDFINNMTHEFKTPISTIALASEAIAKPDILKSKTKVLKYNSLIVDENNRMKHQVDKILQMAVLEEGEFELTLTEVDLHAIIQQAVKNISLQVEQRNGKIVSELEASNYVMNGDALHIANIIHNILDNALKYSSSIPETTITTKNIGSAISIRIRDKGIGISKEDTARVFEKYFRVSTGNLHNVKGFGLGLSYVKLIVEAHQGTVGIDSTPGVGTTVEITFPL